MFRTTLACLALTLPATVLAESSIARFEGGIGSHPNAVVQGVPPGGQPWVISGLSVDVKSDGRISVAGRGLLLGGGNNIGRTANQSVRARLYCGSAASDTPTLVPLEADGDFRIDDVLVPVPASPCVNPTLLILNAGGSWFAAGIPKN
jgi:hypothetical protein